MCCNYLTCQIIYIIIQSCLLTIFRAVKPPRPPPSKHGHLAVHPFNKCSLKQPLKLSLDDTVVRPGDKSDIIMQAAYQSFELAFFPGSLIQKPVYDQGAANRAALQHQGLF